MRWQILCGVALMTLVCNQCPAEEGDLAPRHLVVSNGSGSARELAFSTLNAVSGGSGAQKPLPCRETARLHTMRDDPEILTALSRAVSGRPWFVVGESEGAKVTKYTDPSLARVWKAAAGTQFANCVSQCLSLSPAEKPVRLSFTRDGWQSVCDDVPEPTHESLGFERASCGTTAEWREVLVRQADRASGAWIVCATLATWGDNRNRDYRMKVEHLPLADPTIAVATE